MLLVQDVCPAGFPHCVLRAFLQCGAGSHLHPLPDTQDKQVSNAKPRREHIHRVHPGMMPFIGGTHRDELL